MRRLTRDPAALIPLKHSTYQVLLALGDGESHARLRDHAGGVGDDRRPRDDPARHALRRAGADGGRRPGRRVDAEAAMRAAGRRAATTAAPASAAPSRARNPNACARCSRSPARRTCSESASDRRAARLYAVRCAPFRAGTAHLYGVEMIDAFDRGAGDAPARDGAARCPFVFAAWLNAIGAGLGERRRQRRAAYMRRPAFPRSTSSWPGACCSAIRA